MGGGGGGDTTPTAECAANPAFAPGAPNFKGNRAFDSGVTIAGDDYGFGIDLSLLYELAEGTRVGLVYRQGIAYTLEGEAEFNQSGECQASACGPALTSLAGDVEADIELPDTLTVSISHAVNHAWTMHGDIARTGWSSIQEIEIVNTETGNTIDTLALNYDDTMRYSLGASYHAGNATWRAGVAFDEAPQTDPEFATPRLPDGDRIWLNLGYNLALGGGSSIDIGYAHAFVDGTKINKEQRGHRLRGEFELEASIFAVQGNWRF